MCIKHCTMKCLGKLIMTQFATELHLDHQWADPSVCIQRLNSLYLNTPNSCLRTGCAWLPALTALRAVSITILDWSFRKKSQGQCSVKLIIRGHYKGNRSLFNLDKVSQLILLRVYKYKIKTDLFRSLIEYQTSSSNPPFDWNQSEDFHFMP